MLKLFKSALLRSCQLVTAGAILAATTSSAFAGDVLLDLSQLDDFDILRASGENASFTSTTTNDIVEASDGLGFVQKIANLTPLTSAGSTLGPAYHWVGIDDMAIAAGTDNLRFGLINSDDDIWSFAGFAVADVSSAALPTFPGIELFTQESGDNPYRTQFILDVSAFAGGTADIGFVVYSEFDGGDFPGIGDNWNVKLSPVPEPGSLALFGLGVLTFAAIRRHRNQ